jgi:uncharacterized protein YaiE (UPF0345 family)
MQRTYHKRTCPFFYPEKISIAEHPPAGFENHMSEKFENISVIKKANVYFGGKVTSRKVLFADGSQKTLGFMQAGEYEFGTEAPELMELLGGSMEVKLDGASEWTTYAEGQSFNVPGHSKFSLKVPAGGADYCCSYLD